MHSLRLRFCAIDTLFFREMRPQGGPGGMPLQSLFPPPPHTMSGVIHKLLHEVTGIPFPSAGDGKHSRNALNSLRLRGPYLGYMHADTCERLYPWPAHILRTKDGQCAPLTPAPALVQSDLGLIRLPRLPAALPVTLHKNYQPCVDTWLGESDFLQLLADPTYQPQQCFGAQTPAKKPTGPQKLPLFVRETRLGIARDSASRSAADQMLYQLCLIRPVPQLVFEMDVVAPFLRHANQESADAVAALHTLERELGSGCIVRFGAEGHCAHVSVAPVQAAVPAPTLAAPPASAANQGAQVAIVFTTPADFGKNIHDDFAANWIPQNFTRHPSEKGMEDKKEDRLTSWRGFADAESGVELDIVSTVCGKYLREGGWSENGRLSGPRDARPLLPAGSVWFCRVLRGDINQLRGKQLGIGRELGRGEIALGTWHSEQ